MRPVPDGIREQGHADLFFLVEEIGSAIARSSAFVKDVVSIGKHVPGESDAHRLFLKLDFPGGRER